MQRVLCACFVLLSACTADNQSFGPVLAPETGSDTGDDAGAEVAQPDTRPAADTSDAAPAVDTAPETAADTSPVLPEGAACTSPGTPCAKGLDCIQTAGGFCSDAYEGACTARPTSCSGVPRETICSCDGGEFRNECEARVTGYTRVMVACHTGGG
jgi:hypothetical protein